MFETNSLVWARDDSGHRHLCPMSALKDMNHVRESEKGNCVSDDFSLDSWKTVPSNDPEGRIKFFQSASPN